MPRKKKTTKMKPEEVAPFLAEDIEEIEELAEDKAPLDPSLELVKVRVKTGTLAYEEGTFQKGDVIYVSRKRAAQFDPNDIQILK